MALRAFTLTLNGSAQQLSSVLTGDTSRGGTKDEAYRTLILQGDPANTHVVYVGDSNLVSSTVFGFAVPIPVATANPTGWLTLSWSHSGPVKLSDFWVTGTTNEKLHILGVPF